MVVHMRLVLGFLLCKSFFNANALEFGFAPSFLEFNPLVMGEVFKVFRMDIRLFGLCFRC
jgi:hypothetical protein